LNRKAIFLGLLLALSCFVSTAQASVIELVNQYSDTYDPSVTYVPVGQIEPDIYSFQFFFSDPDDALEVMLQAPVELIGLLEWAVSAGLNGTGITYFGGILAAGETSTFDVGFIPGTSSEGLIPQAFAMRALGVTEPIPFGGNSGNNFFSVLNDGGTGSVGGGTVGGDNDQISSVPLPMPLSLMVIGGLALMKTRRKKGF
jgi:hypothetical protein